MKWDYTTNKALGYTSWMLVARHMPGDPSPIYYSRLTHHIEADNMRFASRYAVNFIGVHPWGYLPYRVLPDDAFTALSEGGLPALAAYRMVHGTEEEFIYATTDGEGA